MSDSQTVSNMISYKNSDIRSILNGLGYRSQLNTNDPDFPISQDESELTYLPTRKAIMKFQVDYDLIVDGIANPQTIKKMQEEMYLLHNMLNLVLGTNILVNQPFYGYQTVSAVQKFQRRFIITIDGLASFSLREELLETVEDNQVLITHAHSTTA
jgi:peptidoglycan hydrolase-like protein with peptidoglycan-binding domain